MYSSDGKNSEPSFQVSSREEKEQPDSAKLESNSFSFSPADLEQSPDIGITESTQDGPTVTVLLEN